METRRIRSEHKNIDHGFTSPFMLAYLTPPPDVSLLEGHVELEVDLPLLATPEESRRESIRIYYKQFSRPDSKKWMLLVNGFASSTKLWDYQVSHLLKNGYNLVLFDLLGQGNSSKPDGVKYTIEAQVKAMEAIVAATPLNQGKFYLTGISAGGIISQRFAFLHQERLAALSLLATTPKVDGRLAFTQEIQRLYLGNANLSDQEKLSFCAYFLVEHIFSDSFFRKFKPVIYGVIEQNVRNNTVGTYLGALSSVDDFDMLAELGRIRVPTLIFSGLHDKVIETHFGILLNRHLPNSQRYILKGVYASHTFILEMFETFNAVFVEALAGIDQFQGSTEPFHVENAYIQEFATDRGPGLEI